MRGEKFSLIMWISGNNSEFLELWHYTMRKHIYMWPIYRKNMAFLLKKNFDKEQNEGFIIKNAIPKSLIAAN